MRLCQVPPCQVRHTSASVRQPWWNRRLFVFLLASLVSLFAATSALAQFLASAPAPTNLSATPSTGQVALAWSPSTSGFPAPPDHAPLDGGPSYSTYHYYYIYRSTTSGVEGSTPLYKVSESTAQPNGASTATYTDSSVVNGVTYYYQVTAVTISVVSGTDPTTTSGPESARSNEANATPLVRINCGGADYTDGAGKLWNGDKNYTGGAPISTTAAITGTNDPTLYEAQRSSAQFSYAEPVANGTYVLSLLFAEIQGNTTGQRTFNVTANGTTVLSSYDIYQDAGGANKAVVKTFPVTITNGQFSLSLTAVTGNAALAAFSLLKPRPAADIPPPGWAIDAVPTDSGSEADGAGPGSSMQVSLPSGVEENMPGPDLGAYNPVGPSVSYERMYRSTLAAQGYGSPGLSPGWVDNYDLRVLPGDRSYKLLYPNGAQEPWGGTTGSLSTPPGAPYLANAPTAGTLTMTMKDRSVFTFTQVNTISVNYPMGAYLLTKMTNLVGHSITLNRDTAANNYRVLSITNDAASPVTLLKFNYGGAALSSVEDLASSTASEHRQVGYTFTGTGGSLSNVTQVAPDGGTASDLWRYQYQTISNEPFLNSVSTPDPSDATGATYTSATVTYDPTGFVTAHTDANSRLRTFGFGPGGVQLQVFNHAGDTSPVQQWIQNFGAYNVDTGFVDAANYTANVSYAGTPSPYLPDAVTNRNRQKTSITYDPANNYGNVMSTTDPRGVQVNMTYQYPSDFALGQLATTQTVNGSNSLAGTSFTYYAPADGVINGLLKTVTAPQPGAASSAATVTTNYQYDALGNVTQMTTPGPNGTTTITYNYTAGYNGTTQPEALGEPLAVTVSGPAGGSVTTTTVTYKQYDGRGNCTATIDCLGNKTDFQFNLADQPVSTLLPATGQTGTGRSHTDMAYQYVGGPMSTASLYDEGSTSSPVRQTINAYGHEGELLKVSDLKGPVMAYQYDGRYRRIAVQDGQNIQNGQGKSTYYQFDPVGNLHQVLYPLSTNAGVGTYDSETYTYDADSNLLARTDGNNAATTYMRDTTIDSRLTGITYPAGSNTSPVSLGYDIFERLSSLGNGEVSKTYTYDDIDDLRTAAVSFTNGPQNQTLTYDYNPDGSRQQMTFSLPIGSSGQQIYTYQYDGLGQLTRAGFPWTGGFANHTYVTNATTGAVRMGWLKTSQTPAFKTTYTYNPLGQITTLLNTSAFDNTTTSQFNLAYDAVGNKVSSAGLIPAQNSAPAASRNQSWTYDARDEVLEDQSIPTSGNAYNESYNDYFNYDLSQNLLGFRASAAGSTANKFNFDNQITNTGFSFDGEGRPTAYASSTPLSGPAFDIEGRLVSLSSPAFSATYAPDDRRASKTAANATTYYVYDEDGSPMPLLEERVSSGNPGIFEAFGLGADGLRARYTGSTGQYDVYQWDPSGSYVQRTQQQTYPTFGNRVADTGPFEAWGGRLPDRLASTGGSVSRQDPVGFQGQAGAYSDYETGLVLMGHRYYDPGTGRFLTRDPKGYGGGINLYGFTGNNPVNESDPDGLTKQDAVNALQKHRGDIIRIAAHVGIQPELLAGAVWNEMDPKGWLPDNNGKNRKASILLFAQGRVSSFGLTQIQHNPNEIHSFEDAMSGIGNNFAERLMWATKHDANDHQNLLDTAIRLRLRASAPNRFPSRLNALTPNEMAIVLTEYNQPPKGSPLGSARPSEYGRRFLDGYSSIERLLHPKK